MLNILRALARLFGIRRPFRLALEVKSQTTREGLPFVLVVSHEASRTGAPILALNLCRQLKERYNVVALLLGPGELVEEFREASDALVGPYAAGSVNPFLAERVISALCARISIQFAVVNSVASRAVLRPLSQHYLPTVFLVHEFYQYHCTDEEMIAAVAWASSTVFGAEIVRRSASMERLQLAIDRAHVIPQGKCEIPSEMQSKNGDRTLVSLRKILGDKPRKPFLVIGAGTIEYRKGVDLFIATAGELQRVYPDAEVLMVWIGKVVPSYRHYAQFVKEQVQQSGAHDKFVLLDETENLEEIYDLADACFISSRLDPLPNIGIDAMSLGLPVLCFASATGFAEMLSANDITKECVLPFLDIPAATRQILKMAGNHGYTAKVSAAVRLIAEVQFDMRTYVSRLEAIAMHDRPLLEQMRADVSRLKNLSVFQPEIFLTTDIELHRDAAVLQFAKYSQSGVFLRKPSPGFYPNRLIAVEGADAVPVNSLLAFHDRGCPPGPWQIPVIDVSSPTAHSIEGMRIAVHVHVYYPELLDAILGVLKQQLPQCDLFLSVPSQGVATKVGDLVSGWAGAVTIRVVPNRGRDIGPLLTEFAPDLSSYDVVGHLHTKKSVHVVGSNLVVEWVTYLSENLVGGRYPSATRIIAEFVKDPALGLVFPDDPNIIGWDQNLRFATALALRLRLDALPPGPFPFPVGTMFWARPTALRPLFETGLQWDDYPEEPLPIDGTMLHALERLLPSVVEKAGFTFAVTYAPGVRR